MVISVNNLLSSTVKDRIGIEGAEQSTVDIQNSFSDLLRNSLQETSDSATLGTALPPLTREQLTFIVRIIQTQINRRLYNMVLNSGAEMNYYPSRMLPDYTNQNPASLTEASNYRQTPPINNSQRTDSQNNFDAESASSKKARGLMRLMPGNVRDLAVKNVDDPAENVMDDAPSKNKYKKTDPNLESIIEKAAAKFGIDPDLIRSVIKTESNFNSRATSPKGAMGLMQLMPGTARDLGVRNAYDPEENIMGGTRYLKTLLNRYDGKVDVALAAYNWGMGNLEKNPRRLPQETSNYISRVNNHYKNFRAST
ncbi:MAG: lytic transglycosylase domain-containing protein [Smithella sp.]